MHFSCAGSICVYRCYSPGGRLPEQFQFYKDTAGMLIFRCLKNVYNENIWTILFIMTFNKEDFTKVRENDRILSDSLLENYKAWLKESEKSTRTVQKYGYYLNLFQSFLGGEQVTKQRVLCWKEELKERFSPGTVNGALAALNGLFRFCGWEDLQVRFLKVGRQTFCQARRELTRNEYIRLVRAARNEGDERLALVLQTICSTGIRISELSGITVEAVRARAAKIECKGKIRTVFLPTELCQLLNFYAQKMQICAGPVFVTRRGKPLDRSNVWRDMKKLSEKARVDQEKIFPHNLRHLFARMYYSQEKDLLRLADILGHSDINTTRVYTIESGENHIRQLEQLGLVVEQYNRISLSL